DLASTIWSRRAIRTYGTRRNWRTQDEAGKCHRGSSGPTDGQYSEGRVPRAPISPSPVRVPSVFHPWPQSLRGLYTNPLVETLDQIKTRIAAAVPGAQLQIIPNDSPANQPSLLVDCRHARAIAQSLRDDPQLRLDYASNVTGVDWPDRVEKTRTKVKKMI